MPVEDKLAIHETNYISLHNTHTCHSAQQTKQHASNIRAAYYFYLAGKNYWWSNTNYHWLWWVQRMQTKKHCHDYLWHFESLWGKFRYRNQTNILILSWSNFFQKWISKSNPDPKKSQVSCRISNPDPGHAHLCQLPAQRISQTRAAPAPRTTRSRPAASSTRTHSSVGSRTRPVNAGTRNPRDVTRPAQDSNLYAGSCHLEICSFCVQNMLAHLARTITIRFSVVLKYVEVA